MSSRPFTDFDEFQNCADIDMRYLGVATPDQQDAALPVSPDSISMIEIEAVAVVNS